MLIAVVIAPSVICPSIQVMFCSYGGPAKPPTVPLESVGVVKSMPSVPRQLTYDVTQTGKEEEGYYKMIDTLCCPQQTRRSVKWRDGKVMEDGDGCVEGGVRWTLTVTVSPWANGPWLSTPPASVALS